MTLWIPSGISRNREFQFAKTPHSEPNRVAKVLLPVSSMMKPSRWSGLIRTETLIAVSLSRRGRKQSRRWRLARRAWFPAPRCQPYRKLSREVGAWRQASAVPAMTAPEACRRSLEMSHDKLGHIACSRIEPRCCIRCIALVRERAATRVIGLRRILQLVQVVIS